MKNPRRAFYLVLEGVDGAGKTRLARELVRAARPYFRRVGRWKEPASRALGTAAVRWAARDPWTSAVYFSLDRLQSRGALDRALGRYDLLVADRSYESTLAYQGSALRRKEYERLSALQKSIARPPDLFVLLDIAPARALGRVSRRRSRRTPLERRTTLERVARAYRSRAHHRRWIVLDARAPPVRQARALIERILPRARDQAPPAKRI